MKTDDKLDTKGLLCPLPVLKLRKRIKDLKIGSIIKIITDDPAAEIDIPHFCNETGNKILKKIKNDKCTDLTFYIQKC